jgi:hypothetical protein
MARRNKRLLGSQPGVEKETFEGIHALNAGDIAVIAKPFHPCGAITLRPWRVRGTKMLSHLRRASPCGTGLSASLKPRPAPGFHPFGLHP